MLTWKSRPSQCPAVVQKKVKRTGAFCPAGTRMSTYSWPVPMDVESVSWACCHSSQVQCNRNGEAAWIRKVPPAGSERTCRLNFQISKGGACAAVAVAVGDFRDQAEDLAVRRGAHQLDVLGMRPHQRHGASGGTSKSHVGLGQVRQSPDLLGQQVWSKWQNPPWPG